MLQVQNLTKRYDGFTAVDNLSFEVHRGEVFGLLGPNGAGKTTTIRAVMDIIKPDEGQISVLGQPPGAVRERVGYLPEERGLYRNLKLLDMLTYLAELKGMPRSEGRRQAEHWLERVELADRASSKVKELSRGMQQKLQFAASLVHDPDLAILDEPFSGLDPVNVELIKTLIRELQAEGKTIVLSAHQMNLVEVLCDRILLINEGRAVLYGDLEAIKREHAPGTVRIRSSADLSALPGIEHIQGEDGTAVVTLQAGTGPQDLLRALIERNISVELYEVASAPLEEIFITVVKEGRHA
jgi:ABC-2 type transport system ATP-binding protein